MDVGVLKGVVGGGVVEVDGSAGIGGGVNSGGGGVPGGLDGGGGGVEQDWDCGRILGVLYYPFQVFPSSIKLGVVHLSRNTN